MDPRFSNYKSIRLGLGRERQRYELPRRTQREWCKCKWRFRWRSFVHKIREPICHFLRHVFSTFECGVWEFWVRADDGAGSWGGRGACGYCWGNSERLSVGNGGNFKLGLERWTGVVESYTPHDGTQGRCGEMRLDTDNGMCL